MPAVKNPKYRACDVCANPYRFHRSDSRFCSAKCRQTAHRHEPGDVEQKRKGGKKRGKSKMANVRREVPKVRRARR